MDELTWGRTKHRDSTTKLLRATILSLENDHTHRYWWDTKSYTSLRSVNYASLRLLSLCFVTGIRCSLAGFCRLPAITGIKRPLVPGTIQQLCPAFFFYNNVFIVTRNDGRFCVNSYRARGSRFSSTTSISFPKASCSFPCF